MPNKTTEQFILDARRIHGDKYDYSKSVYTKALEKIEIICPRHGSFWQEASSHLKGCGCKKCAVFGGTLRKLTTEQFIERAKQIHGDRYDYSKVEYKTNGIKVCIICPEHGEFWQRPNDHFDGNGCVKCARENRKLTTEKFIEKAKQVHGDRYDYSKVDYKDMETKVCIICPEHGEFWQAPYNHIGNNQNCPECAKIESHGEEEIRKILEELKISFQQEKFFRECCDKRMLPFDFYLPDYNLVIEYQGEQHFKPTKKFGGEEKFLLRRKHDEIKRSFCKENNIRELEILYTDYNNIKQILLTELRRDDAE